MEDMLRLKPLKGCMCFLILNIRKRDIKKNSYRLGECKWFT